LEFFFFGMDKTLLILFIGLVLGIKHAFEADHLVAVSTMVSQHKHPLKAALVGTFWGIGHTLTLFVAGIFVLLFKFQITQQLSAVFEKSVGIMIILLGLFNLFKRQNDELHSHTHSHDGNKHEHVHVHSSSKKLHSHHKSFLVGIIHGLDGSGALMLLVLSTIHSTSQGLFYVLIFGIGSIIGMSAISMILGIPILYGSKKIPNLERYLQLLTGVIGVLFGGFLLLHT